VGDEDILHTAVVFVVSDLNNIEILHWFKSCVRASAIFFILISNNYNLEIIFSIIVNSSI